MNTRLLSEWPAIFYSPHQDDEAIAMGGAIYEHVSVGRPVYLVLLTNGHPSLNMMLPFVNRKKKVAKVRTSTQAHHAAKL